MAVCNAKGTKCLNKPIFLGGLTTGSEQKIPFSLPLAKVQEAARRSHPAVVVLEIAGAGIVVAQATSKTVAAM
jgi:hypothetical protein